MKISANTSLRLQRFILFILAFMLVNIFLMPLVYGVVTSLKSDEQINTPKTPLIPSSQKMFEYQGTEYPVVEPDGTVKEMALYKKGRQASSFVDPENPEEKPFEWTGNWRGLKTVWKPDLKWKNYYTAWKQIDFLKLLLNTLKYAVISTAGAVFSAALAGYGFSRFNFPGKKVLFSIVLATIILPPSVTLIPTYTFFYKIGWVGTWLPVIVPSLFGNGYNIFLLRQFFLGIPRQLDEAARIDGAGPFRRFWPLHRAVPDFLFDHSSSGGSGHHGSQPVPFFLLLERFLYPIDLPFRAAGQISHQYRADRIQRALQHAGQSDSGDIGHIRLHSDFYLHHRPENSNERD